MRALIHQKGHLNVDITLHYVRVVALLRFNGLAAGDYYNLTNKCDCIDRIKMSLNVKTHAGSLHDITSLFQMQNIIALCMLFTVANSAIALK